MLIRVLLACCSYHSCQQNPAPLATLQWEPATAPYCDLHHDFVCGGVSSVFFLPLQRLDSTWRLVKITLLTRADWQYGGI
ncbi:hypothetical protein DFH29DRAFT_939698 [Suillus ampliporus]|nr:hypothetical protein DFH29DRAFT_939698 [Suillus ampliporus]